MIRNKTTDELSREDRLIFELGALLPGTTGGDVFTMLRVQTMRAELDAIRGGREFTDEDRQKAADTALARWEEANENEARALVAISRLNQPARVKSWWWGWLAS